MKSHPPHSPFKDLDEWQRGNLNSLEQKWVNWAGKGRRFFAYWAAGSGTLTRTANLDLLSKVQLVYSVFVIPELYNDRTDIVRIEPRPIPKAPHDLVPKTFLTECVKRTPFLQ
jgi:hypothetical protein